MTAEGNATERIAEARSGVLVERVGMRDFRNYERLELMLAPGVTVICGQNGAGKTNLLEGLYFGCVGRSCRTSSERELVRRGQELVRVEVTTRSGDERHLLEVGFVPGQTKRTRVNGAAVEGPLPAPPRPLVSVFLPERLVLVKGPPSVRRAHLDQVVTALWPARGSTRAHYSRSLAQRNALLGRIRAGAADAGSLDAWDGELARHGLRLMEDRRTACASLAPVFAQRAADLGLPEQAELEYRSRSAAEDEARLIAELVERRSSDLERGFTSHGPHRDDVLLTHGGASLRGFGSQGQQRTAVLALLIAERDLLVDRTGAAPLLLLDDVMSELDPLRRRYLAELLRCGSQALVTTSDASHVPGVDSDDVEVVHVRDGVVATSPPAEQIGERRRVAV